jgi:hypothetical protein
MWDALKHTVFNSALQIFYCRTKKERRARSEFGNGDRKRGLWDPFSRRKNFSNGVSVTLETAKTSLTRYDFELVSL